MTASTCGRPPGRTVLLGSSRSYLDNFKGGGESIWHYQSLATAYRQRGVAALLTERELAVAEMTRLCEAKRPPEPPGG